MFENLKKSYHSIHLRFHSHIYQYRIFNDLGAQKIDTISDTITNGWLN